MDGPLSAVEYRDAGQSDRVTHTTAIQVALVGIGSHLKIRFEAAPKTATNPYGQIGLKLLKVYGEPAGYNFNNRGISSVISGKERVDSTRLELGVPLRHLAESEEKSYSYAQVDDATRLTLVDMEKVRNEVLHSQHNSDRLKEITKDLSDVLQVSVLFVPCDSSF